MYPVPAFTILICESISTKNKPNDSSFWLSYSLPREHFASLMFAFIRVRKMRLVFSFSSLWGEVGQGEELASLGSWRRRRHCPQTMHILTECPPQPWLLESFRWQKTSKPKQTSSQHLTLAEGPPSSAPTCCWFLGTALTGSSSSLWATRGAHFKTTPPLWLSYNPSPLLKGVGFNFPSCALLLPRGGEGDSKIQRRKYTCLHPPK